LIGNDKLYGGAGRDAFVFKARLDSVGSTDFVRDFSVRDDSIYLDNAVFRKVGSGSLAHPKKLVADAFHIGKTAADAQDRIVYDKVAGTLFYDPDGTGSAAQIRFAILAKGLKMTASDFFVI
jgi:Ca2+-binding RTX toxin-like protein